MTLYRITAARSKRTYMTSMKGMNSLKIRSPAIRNGCRKKRENINVWSDKK
jgi:hypothetical protein